MPMVLNNVVVALPKVSFRSPTHRTVSQLSVREVAPLPFFWYFLPQFRQAMRRYESPLPKSFHCSLSAIFLGICFFSFSFCDLPGNKMRDGRGVDRGGGSTDEKATEGRRHALRGD